MEETGENKMQLIVHIGLGEPLVLPINYNHIVQSIIYNALGSMPEYADFLHNEGYSRDKRQYRMFQFSQLSGDYEIQERKIIFKSYVTFEIRSPEPLLIRLLGEHLWNHGIRFGTVICEDIQMELYDYTVEETSLRIRMKSPMTVYSTDYENGIYYYNPEEEEFYHRLNENFLRKYQAYYGVSPIAMIDIKKIGDKVPKKFVTRYQGSYITAWYGQYQISGKRKYLDFLYQVGLGSKNSQGFGMFEIL